MQKRAGVDGPRLHDAAQAKEARDSSVPRTGNANSYALHGHACDNRGSRREGQLAHGGEVDPSWVRFRGSIDSRGESVGIQARAAWREGAARSIQRGDRILAPVSRET